MLLPLFSHFARIANELPIGRACLLSELNYETISVCGYICYLRQLDMLLVGWDGSAVVEGKSGLFGYVAGVGDGFVACEDEQPLVGEEEALVFLFEEGLDELFAIDVLRVGFFLDFVFELLADESPSFTVVFLH